MQFYKENQLNLVEGHDLKTEVTLVKELINVQCLMPSMFPAYLRHRLALVYSRKRSWNSPKKGNL